GATAFPQAIGLAATWDVELMTEVAAAVASETASRGIRQVLSPVVNIARDVRWGRVEETYGEDPFLASRMAAAFVRSFEERGIVATPKHFVANVGAGGRDSYPIADGERQLWEVDFPPFLAAIREGGARSIMTAYNSWDGLPCSANPDLLTDILKGVWGFRGFVISDACSVGGSFSLHLTADSYLESGRQAWASGLDVLFQTELAHMELFRGAITDGLVSRTRIDDAVRRVLRAKMELGLFENPLVDPAEAERWNGHPDHPALARQVARESIVLLKNEGGVLPLPRTGPSSIAVIGLDAVEARLGGYSGPGIRKISLLDALRERAGARTTVLYIEGCGRLKPRSLTTVGSEFLRSSDGNGTEPGLRGEYFANPTFTGEPAARRLDPTVDFRWTFLPPAPGLGAGWYAVRWQGSLIGPETGPRRIGVEGNDGFRLFLDGRLLVDRWRKESYRVVAADVRLEKGKVYDLRLEFYEPVRNGEVRLVWDYGRKDDPDRRIQEAVRLARDSQLAVIAAGIEEGEGRDRADIRLPGRQAELIRRVAATGTPTVVVIYGGSAVEMSEWISDADAVLLAWYPGEEGGGAVADILYGDANPSGRLPVTFPRSVGQLPLVYNHKPTGRLDDYIDLSGEPLFPFGFGLSYTDFRYSGLTIEPGSIEPDGTARVACTVTNAGQVAGAEVVQLYVHDPLASVARPVLELKGFRRVVLAPGASETVSFELGPRELSFLGADMRDVVEPGEFQVLVGSSSRDIRLKGVLTVAWR
ncbi:MAG: glycoside hydrolase family 3 C-terminal domain-containing protein, partial [Candidatus Aminicenantes bacterium]|nr:glycoside hydrolase family 3 C-terminal domain-containing protein [Candidatus Aminicenantes bacterium]